jgi:hypothetical protein
MTSHVKNYTKDFLNFFAKSIAEEIQRADHLAKSKWKQVNCKADSEGRLRAFTQLLVNIHDRREWWTTAIETETKHLETYLAAEKFPLVTVSLERLARDGLLLDVNLAASSNEFERLADTFSRITSYQYAAARLSTLDPGFTYTSDVGQECSVNHHAHCVLTARGSWDQARWLGRYLMNFHRNGETCFTDEFFNPEIRLMLRTLAHITEQDAWPSLAELPTDMGRYRTLFETVENPEAFSSALMQLLDFRMARYNGFQDIGVGTRKMHWGGVLGAEDWAVFPVELFAFQALAERYLGIKPALDIDHPWINNPLTAQLHAIDPAWEDDTLRKVVELADQQFGQSWRTGDVLPSADGATTS